MIEQQTHNESAATIVSRLATNLRDASVGNGIHPFTGRIILDYDPQDQTSWKAAVGVTSAATIYAAEQDALFLNFVGPFAATYKQLATTIISEAIPTTPQFDPRKLTVTLRHE